MFFCLQANREAQTRTARNNHFVVVLSAHLTMRPCSSTLPCSSSSPCVPGFVFKGKEMLWTHWPAGSQQPPSSPASHSHLSAINPSTFLLHLPPTSAPAAQPTRPSHIAQPQGSPYCLLPALNKLPAVQHALLSHLSLLFKRTAHSTSCAQCLCLVLPWVHKG